jgi:succinate-semialdehyde dehydrogenase/glutarate-semialdehyde dehydrogenase
MCYSWRIFSRECIIKLSKGIDVAARVEAGVVFINGQVKSDPRLPFGGVKGSGYGRELSHYGIRKFVNIQTVWVG